MIVDPDLSRVSLLAPEQKLEHVLFGAVQAVMLAGILLIAAQIVSNG